RIAARVAAWSQLDRDRVRRAIGADEGQFCWPKVRLGAAIVGYGADGSRQRNRQNVVGREQWVGRGGLGSRKRLTEGDQNRCVESRHNVSNFPNEYAAPRRVRQSCVR